MGSGTDLKAQFLVDRDRFGRRDVPALPDRLEEIGQRDAEHPIHQLRANVQHQHRPQDDVHRRLDGLARVHPRKHHEHHNDRPKPNDQCKEVIGHGPSVFEHRDLIGRELYVVALHLGRLDHGGLAGCEVHPRRAYAIQRAVEHFAGRQIEHLRRGLIRTTRKNRARRRRVAESCVLGHHVGKGVVGPQDRLIIAVDRPLHDAGPFCGAHRGINIGRNLGSGVVTTHEGVVRRRRRTCAPHGQGGTGTCVRDQPWDGTRLLARQVQQGTQSGTLDTQDRQGLGGRRPRIAGIENSSPDCRWIDPAAWPQAGCNNLLHLGLNAIQPRHRRSCAQQRFERVHESVVLRRDRRVIR